MKTTLKLLAIFTLLVVAFGQPAGASAGGGTNNGHFRDLGSNAYFYSTDPSGCVVTEVSIFASQHYFQSPPGPGSEGPFASMSIFQQNVCTGILLLSASGATMTDLDFQVDQKLNSATLNATVHVYEGVSPSEFDIFLDLTWTGFGPTSRETVHFHSNSPGCKMKFRSNGLFRSAEASGSVSDGITNFTPEAAVSANLFRTSSGNLTIGCN
jgi:hypothetical protein